MASTRSGRIAGAIANASSAVDRVNRTRPTASMVPSTVEKTIAPNATSSELTSASPRSASSNSSPYQRNDRPVRFSADRPLLNDVTTKVAIGR